MEAALAGESSNRIDSFVPLHRHGYLQEAYFTYSYSPVCGADGTVEGVLDIATETTQQVIDRRRLELLSRLHELLGGIEHADEIPERALPLLRGYARDLPAVDIFRPTESRSRHPTVPPGGAVEAIGTERAARFPLDSLRPATDRPILEIRLSDNLAADEDYLGFLRLIASALGQAMDRTRSSDEERDAAAIERSTLEALQRSLLTEPFQPDNLEARSAICRPSRRRRSAATGTDVLEGSHELKPQALCDRLMAQLDDTVEDDVALLVLRVGTA